MFNPDSHKPVFFYLQNDEDKKEYIQLIDSTHNLTTYDKIDSQLSELIKLTNPSKQFSEVELQAAILKHLNGVDKKEYGVWVYYPWSNRLVHLLDEEEFIQVRTNRNQLKITKEELKALRKNKIGVIGLSVGQSASVTMAMERCCGEIRIADFDEIELTNLNRIRTGVHNLGVPKVKLVAREIAEIDPFLKVKCFHNGITKENIDDFILSDGKLDLLVDECDGFAIKVLARLKAQLYKIPLIMEASDRGCLDIERYDIEPGRPIFHGLLSDFNTNFDYLSNLTKEEMIQVIQAIHPPETLSKRLKESFPEIGKTITTWPQLASGVTLGGAITTDIARKIALGYSQVSGRFFVDIDQIIQGS